MPDPAQPQRAGVNKCAKGQTLNRGEPPPKKEKPQTGKNPKQKNKGGTHNKTEGGSTRLDLKQHFTIAAQLGLPAKRAEGKLLHPSKWVDYGSVLSALIHLFDHRWRPKARRIA